MLQGLLKEKPYDPYAWMANQLKGADRPKPIPSKPAPVAPKEESAAAPVAAPAATPAAPPAAEEPIPLANKNSAFVFVKPHANTDAVNALVKEEFAAKGIKILTEGVIPGEEIDKKKLIDQHYYAIASKATILKPDAVNVPNDKFKAQFGIDWKDALSSGKAFNAMDACEYFGCDAAELGKIWVAAGEAKRVVKLGGGFYCGELTVGDKSAYVLNAFFMSMRGKFVAPGSSIHYYSVTFDSRKLSWADFRGQVLGPTDPAKAPAGSLRGKILASWEKFGLAGAPNGTDNGVHASASPFEGFAERMNWLGATPEEDEFGAQMLKAGVSKETIQAWSVDPRVKISETEEGSLFDNLEDINADECLEKAVGLNKLATAAAAAPAPAPAPAAEEKKVEAEAPKMAAPPAPAPPAPAAAPTMDLAMILKVKTKISGGLLGQRRVESSPRPLANLQRRLLRSLQRHPHAISYH
jgi:nucleoside diphosphate kinase